MCARSRFRSVRGRWPVDQVSLRRPKDSFLRGPWPRLRSALTGSPVGMAVSGLRCLMSYMSRCYGRVVHLRQLSTSCCHDAVAFGYRRVNVPLDGDFHPAVCTPSQPRSGPAVLLGSALGRQPADAGGTWGTGGSGQGPSSNTVSHLPLFLAPAGRPALRARCSNFIHIALMLAQLSNWRVDE